MEENKYAVEIENLSKAYQIYRKPWHRVLSAFSSKVPHKDFYALKDINIKFPKGETIGIIGKNGNGKSTLLKLITGVTRPTTGTIKTEGRIVAMLELTAGFDKELTGMENIYLKGRTIGLSKEEIAAKVDDIIAFADIGDYINQPVRTYSSGMKSRLGFAVSANMDPDILIVDEVLAVGDASFKLKCLNRMDEFRKQGKTILFVSHSLSTVKAFCTYCMWLKNGQMMDYGETGIVVQEYQDYLKSERKTERARLEQIGEKALLIKGDVLKATQQQLCNSEGEEQSVFGIGEDICVYASYVVKTEAEVLTCGVTISDSDGKEIFGSNRRGEQFELKNEIGKHKFLFTLQHPNLLPGHYTLNCEIWNNNSGFFRKVLTDVPFEVTSEIFAGTGIVALEATCESK